MTEPCARCGHDGTVARGLCRPHYAEARRRGEFTADMCSAASCGGVPEAKGLCGTHYRRLQRHGDIMVGRLPWPVRFWHAVDTSGDCWLWTGGALHKGYGRLKVRGRMVLAHRVSYELEIGPIPERLVIDHLCRTLACVRPSHLEAVTQGVNMLRTREEACAQGHPLDGENLYVQPNGRRQCKACRRQADRRRPQSAATVAYP